MSVVETAKKTGADSVRPRTVIAVFAATLLSSALLMFLIQPMFAKMALPRLGGTAAVWSLALVFFQGILLLGYAYAHLVVRHLSLRTGIILHVLVMAAAVGSLPISIGARWDMPPESGEAFWLMALFASSVGLPFFAISANAPLLQSWFSRSGHAQANDPYFLYGASNAGSFAALIAYPLLVEPLLGLSPQTHLWSSAYVLLVVMVGTCGLLAATAAGAEASNAAAEVSVTSFGWRRCLIWIVLSFVPSGLLVSTTAHIATDLVSAPFMWVVPLALFLLTFVITFQANPVLSRDFVLKHMGLVIAPICIFVLSPATQIWLVPLHLLAIFTLMMACHGELVRLRPKAGELTSFYLLMSVGGVLGGMFASLVAPNVFDSIAEYPLLIVMAFAVVGFVRSGGHISGRVLASLLVVPLVAAAVWFAGDSAATKKVVMLGGLLMAMGLLLVYAREQLAQAVILFSVFMIYETVAKTAPPLYQSRSFYGVLTVLPAQEGRVHLLAHGTTEHGSQLIKDENGLRLTDNPEPQSYYYATGPFGSVFRHLRETHGKLGDVAVVGLGTGAMLCHALPGENWSFYEIDPHVVKIAADPDYFTYLRDCGPSRVVIGDGRLKLAHEKDQSFDLIVLDAFSSDSVPAHLMTAEALNIYMSKLKPGGMVVYHVSNRFMELGSIVEGAVRQAGYSAWYNRLDHKYWATDRKKLDLRGYLAVVTKTAADGRGLAQDPAWRQAAPDEAAPAWTDDYSNIVGAIWRHLYGPTPFVE